MRKQNQKAKHCQSVKPVHTAEPGHTAEPDVAEQFMQFQRTGDLSIYERVWTEIHPLVRDFARRRLQKLGVRADDSWAQDDVVSQTNLKLLGLAAPDAGGRFDLSKTRHTGISALRGWLYAIVANEAVSWTRQYRSGRSVKILPEAALAMNTAAEEGDESILKSHPAKTARADLLPILEECIGMIPDPLEREVVTLKLNHEMSIAETATHLGISASKVRRRLQAAYAVLRPLLEARDVDLAWLAA